MQMFSELSSAKEIEQLYGLSGQAAAVVDGGLFTVWANASAIGQYPFLRLPDGVISLLSPGEAQRIRLALARGEACACASAGLPVTATSLFFSPLGKEKAGVFAVVLLCPPGPTKGAAEQTLSVFSNQIRAPLAQIFSSLYAAANSKACKVTPELAPYFENINRGSYQILRHCVNLTEYTRYTGALSPLSVEYVDLRGLVGELCHSASLLTNHAGVPLACHLPDEALACRCDCDRLQIALLNLLSNACRFTRAGSSISVTLRRQGANGSILVSDSGVGISPDILPHVCDPFFSTASGRYGGAGGGLGLTVAKLCAEAHGGSFTITSVPGERTTVAMLLPLAPPPSGLPLHSPIMREMSCDRFSNLNVILSDVCKCPWP